MQEFEICRADVVSFRVQRTEAFSIYLPMLQFYWGVEKGEIKYSIDMHILYAYEVTWTARNCNRFRADKRPA